MVTNLTSKILYSSIIAGTLFLGTNSANAQECSLYDEMNAVYNLVSKIEKRGHVNYARKESQKIMNSTTPEEVFNCIGKVPEELEGILESFMYHNGIRDPLNYEFRGEYGGSMLIFDKENEVFEWTFTGKKSGAGSLFSGNYSGSGSIFNGPLSGYFAEFSGNKSGSKTEFRGDFSGAGAEFSGYGSGQNGIFSGKYSGANMLLSHDDAASNIECIGDGSCSKTEIAGHNAGRGIKCLGENSCGSMEAKGYQSAAYIHCIGDKSCSNTNFSGTKSALMGQFIGVNSGYESNCSGLYSCLDAVCSEENVPNEIRFTGTKSGNFSSCKLPEQRNQVEKSCAKIFGKEKCVVELK